MSEWEIVKINKNPKQVSEWEIASPNMQQHETKGFKGILEDAFNKSIEKAMELPSALMSLPGEIYGAGEQAISNPKRALQNIGAGFGELGHSILSAPGNARDYLAQKEIIDSNSPSFRLPESVLPKNYNYAEALGAEGEQAGDSLLRGIPSGIAAAPFVSAITSRIPGITNKSIANRLSADKKMAIQQAGEEYNQWFNKTKNHGVGEIERPSIYARDIVKHSQSKHHEALIKFLKNPTVENAHWAQSDLGFLKRHLESVAKKQDLTSTQHNTLKNVIEAQNKIKESMFKEKNMAKNPEFEKEYNKMSHDYANNVVPYKSLEELSEFESKKLKANKLIKNLLNNDEFMLGLGKKYPQLYINQALRSKIAKTLGGGALAGLGFAEANKVFK